MSVEAFSLDQFENATCVVVGLGLLGRATASALEPFSRKINHPSKPVVDWNQSQSIVDAVQFSIGPESERLELIWCAGRAGFSSADDELMAEHLVFMDVIECLAKAHKNLAVSFISSAGGLYEGAGGTHGPSDLVSPVRPYGQWKLKQEQLLRERVAVSRIYRVSSVYGISPSQSRYGIVNALIESTYTNAPAIIYAQASTLRDYVSNIDVGRHIVSQLTTNDSLTEIVASGRPTSITMLANLIKRMSRRNLKISYRSSAENDKNIIFSKRSLIGDFESRSLEEGILTLLSNYKIIKFAEGYAPHTH